MTQRRVKPTSPRRATPLSPLFSSRRLTIEVTRELFSTDRQTEGASGAAGRRDLAEGAENLDDHADQTEDRSPTRHSARDRLCSSSADLLRGSIRCSLPQRDRHRNEENSEDGRVDRKQQTNRHGGADQSRD